MKRYKKGASIETRVLLKGRASYYISSQGVWRPQLDLVLVSLEKDYYPNSYSYFLRVLNISDGNTDTGPVLDEELFIPFQLQKRGGHFLHFPTEEHHIGFAFVDETIASQFYREIEELNFVETKKLERIKLNSGTLKRSKSAKSQNTLSQNLTIKRKGLTKSGIGLLSLFSEKQKAIEPTDNSQSMSSEAAVNTPQRKLDAEPVQSDFFDNYKETQSHRTPSDSDDSFNSKTEEEKLPLTSPPPFKLSDFYTEAKSVSRPENSKVSDDFTKDNNENKMNVSNAIKKFMNSQTVKSFASKPEKSSPFIPKSVAQRFPKPIINESKIQNIERSVSHTKSKPLVPPPAPPLLNPPKASVPSPPPPLLNLQTSSKPPVPPPAPPLLNPQTASKASVPPPPPLLLNPTSTSKSPAPVSSALEAPFKQKPSIQPMKKNTQVKKPSNLAVTTIGTGNHSDLLSSIRNSSLKNLKKVETVNKSELKFQKNETVATPRNDMQRGSNCSNSIFKKRNMIEDQLNSVLSNFTLPSRVNK